MQADHILLQDETTERIAAIRPDQSVESIASLGVPACPIHGWSGGGLLAFPVRHGRRVQLWSVSDGNARRPRSSIAPLNVRALRWFRDRLLVGGRARDGRSPLRAGHVLDGAFEWQPVELSADFPHGEFPISAIDTDDDSVVAAIGPDLLARFEIPGREAQLRSTCRLPNTPDATIHAVQMGSDICAVWTIQRRTSCHPSPSIELWDSVTIHRADSLELLGAIDTPDGLVDMIVAEEELLLLTSRGVFSYAIDELLQGSSVSADHEYLWGAPPIDARRRVVQLGFRPSHCDDRVPASRVRVIVAHVDHVAEVAQFGVNPARLAFARVWIGFGVVLDKLFERSDATA